MAKKIKTIDEKIDDLAAMTQRGFAELRSDITEGFDVAATKAEKRGQPLKFTNRDSFS